MKYDEPVKKYMMQPWLKFVIKLMSSPIDVYTYEEIIQILKQRGFLAHPEYIKREIRQKLIKPGSIKTILYRNRLFLGSDKAIQKMRRAI